MSLWGDMEITHPDIVAAFTKEFPFIKPITVTGQGRRPHDAYPIGAASREILGRPLQRRHGRRGIL